MANWAIKDEFGTGVVRYRSEAEAERAIMELAEQIFGDDLYSSDDPEIDAYLARSEAVKIS